MRVINNNQSCTKSHVGTNHVSHNMANYLNLGGWAATLQVAGAILPKLTARFNYSTPGDSHWRM